MIRVPAYTKILSLCLPLLLFGVPALSAQEGGDSPKGNEAEQQAEGAETGRQTAADTVPDAGPESEAQNAAQDSAYQNAGPESGGTEDAIGEAAPPPPEPSAEEALPDPGPTQIKAPDEKQLNILRYGTETETAALIKNLKTEKDSSLDPELVKLAETSKNKVILSGIFSFFGEMEKSGLEDRAIRIIEERDDEANETVSAAVDYLGKVKAASSIKALEELINSGERAFLNLAIRSLGRTAKGGDGSGADEAAKFLLSYYEEGNPSNEDQREIVAALGETGSAEAVPFLTEMAQNSDERAVLRMAALESIAKLGYEDGLTAVIAAVSAQDPNVRSSAIAALGPFSSTDADKAILDGFRDSYYRTRIGAAQAAGRRRLETAVPYLRQRAQNDEVPAAREEAIKALGAIGNGEAMEILDSFFMDKKSSDRTRVLSAEMLLKNDPSSYAPKIIGALDEAKASNQTNLYNGFLSILSPANAASLENLAARYLYSGTIIEKSYALDMILNNGFKSQVDNIRPLLDEKKYNQSIVRKARTVLERLGIPVEEKKEENAGENLKQETNSQAFPEAAG